MTQVILQEL